jgi:GntR family transcriptional regulator
MASMLFSVKPGDGRPIYRQLVEQVKAALAAGRLRPGEQLPTHRDLARELVIAPLTVKKAYDLLQSEGLVVQAQGKGTFVAKRPAAAVPRAQEDLAARADGLIRQARLLNLSVEELQKLIGKHWGRTP